MVAIRLKKPSSTVTHQTHLENLCNRQRCIPTRRRRTQRLEGANSDAPFNLGNANPNRGFSRGSYSVSVILPSVCDSQIIQENTPMASEPSSPRMDETTLTKGQRRKLNVLRNSVGDAIGEQAFVEWLAAQSSSKDSNDENAALIVDTLWPLVQQAIWLSRAAAISSGADADESSSTGSGHSVLQSNKINATAARSLEPRPMRTPLPTIERLPRSHTPSTLLPTSRRLPFLRPPELSTLSQGYHAI